MLENFSLMAPIISVSVARKIAPEEPKSINMNTSEKELLPLGNKKGGCREKGRFQLDVLL